MTTSFRVGFDASPAHSVYGGIGQYVRRLFPAMAEANGTIDWVGYTSNPHSNPLAELVASPSLTLKPHRSFWLSTNLIPSNDALDVFHGTNFQLHQYGQKKSVLTIHDIWLSRYPQYSKKLFGEKLASWKLSKRAQKASAIIAVSRFTANEIHEVLGISRQNITVIYLGPSVGMYQDENPRQLVKIQQRLGLPSKPYLLFIGGANPRKNHQVLFEAFSRSSQLRKTMVVVALGDINSRGASLTRSAQGLGIADVVFCPGSLSVEDLRILYSHATAYVCPSFYEGFGLPVLDAMVCGTPTVLSQASALPEIAGDAALYFPAHDSGQLTNVLEDLVADHHLQEKLREAGRRRAQRFSWEKAAKETLDLYQQIQA